MPKRLILGGALSAMTIVCALAVSASGVGAQSALPTGWSSRDIGSVGLAGSANVVSGTWTIDASGANIWSSSDEFRFAYQQVTGDLDIRVRVASLENVNDWSKAGVMIRESLAANSRNAFMLVTPGGDARVSAPQQHGRFNDADDRRFGHRASLASSRQAGKSVHWLSVGERDVMDVDRERDDQYDVGRLRRHGRRQPRGFDVGHGDVYECRGSDWHALRLHRRFRHRGLNRDIGSPARAGSASAPNGTFTVAGAGADIWDISDQFHFVYQPLQGDVEVIARIASLQYADDWSKAGVMIRETLTGRSRHAFDDGSGTQGWGFHRRD